MQGALWQTANLCIGSRLSVVCSHGSGAWPVEWRAATDDERKPDPSSLTLTDPPRTRSRRLAQGCLPTCRPPTGVRGGGYGHMKRSAVVAADCAVCGPQAGQIRPCSPHILDKCSLGGETYIASSPSAVRSRRHRTEAVCEWRVRACGAKPSRGLTAGVGQAKSSRPRRATRFSQPSSLTPSLYTHLFAHSKPWHPPPNQESSSSARAVRPLSISRPVRDLRAHVLIPPSCPSFPCAPLHQ